MQGHKWYSDYTVGKRVLGKERCIELKNRYILSFKLQMTEKKEKSFYYISKMCLLIPKR